MHYIENIFCVSITWSRYFGEYRLLDAMYVFFYLDLKSNYYTGRFHVCGQYFGSPVALSTN